MNILRVFDFDDTLVITDARVIVKRPSGVELKLTSQEYVKFRASVDDVLDFSEFDSLNNVRTIDSVFSLFKETIAHHGPTSVVVLSSRTSSVPIKQFLSKNDLDEVEVVALGSVDHAAKANWIRDKIKRDSIKSVEFFDDVIENVQEVLKLRLSHPETEIKAEVVRRQT